MSPRARKVAAALLLVLGVQLWLVFGRGDWGKLPPVIVWAGLIVLALLPPVNRRAARLLELLSNPSPRQRLLVAVIIAIAAEGYLYFTAVRQQRDFFLKIHDEHSYAIQARMLAGGRLWMTAHPAAEAFDSPYVIVRPVYASMYFPGTALMLVPAVWLGLPWWVTPLALSAASAGILYRVMAELTDGVGGLLAVMMLVSLSGYRELSLRLYSQTPMLFLVLCLVWAWLAWRRDRHWWQALILGVIGGWMLIVRPLDAAVFLLPLLIAIALDLRRFDGRTVVALFVGVLPFVTLQLIANRGITGSFLTTPHAFYAGREFPGITLGFHDPRPAATLATQVPQKRLLYESFIPAIKEHRRDMIFRDLMSDRLPRTVSATLPNNLLIILFPLGVAAMLETRRRRRAKQWVIVAPLLLFVVAYAFYVFYFSHYLLVVAPAMIFPVVLAARQLPQLWPRAKGSLDLAIIVAIAGSSLAALPEFDRTAHDDVGAGDLGRINALLANLPHRPAIVLFRWQSGIEPHREPVYNIDFADIDDAEIIRAHDLAGVTQEKLLPYYRRTQPDRHVYVIERMPDGGEPRLHYRGPLAIPPIIGR